MPNYCENVLRISGPETDIDEFVTAITVYDGTLNIAGQLPMPVELEGTSFTIYNDHPDNQELIAAQKAKQEANVAKYGYADWYDWARANWGTKWGDFDHYYNERSCGEHEIQYMTAWCPFIDSFWEVVSAKWPTLTFTVTYDEPGMGFIGGAKYHNGKVLFERYIDDVSQILGDLDWEDDDARDKWLDAKSDLMGSLFEQAEYA